MAKDSTVQTSDSQAQKEASSQLHYSCLTVDRPRIHLLDKPDCFAGAMAKSNLTHQMRYSIQVLEDELLKAETPHVLTLKITYEEPLDLLDDEDGNWVVFNGFHRSVREVIRNEQPEWWMLYADGIRVASGSGDFARQCFEKDEREFLETCKAAVLEANLRENTVREYELLKSVCAIVNPEC